MPDKPQQEDEKNITVRMSKALLQRLDECRRRERDIPNRSDMIRRLLNEQLDAREIPQPDITLDE